MVTEPKPRPLTIDEAQQGLIKLAEEERTLPARIEARTEAQAKARITGDFGKAAVIAEEISYLSGPRGAALKEERQLLKRALWDAMANELERQAADFEEQIPAQQEREGHRSCRTGRDQRV
jgi:hypothetical protein